MEQRPKTCEQGLILIQLDTQKQYWTKNSEADCETILKLCKTTETDALKLAISVLWFFHFRVVKHTIMEDAEWSSAISKWTNDVTSASLLPSLALMLPSFQCSISRVYQFIVGHTDASGVAKVYDSDSEL